MKTNTNAKYHMTYDNTTLHTCMVRYYSGIGRNSFIVYRIGYSCTMGIENTWNKNNIKIK